MQLSKLFLLLAFGFLSLSHAEALIVNSATTTWAPILYAGGTSTDPFTDQQTGDKEGDIVGNALNPSLYKLFDNGGTTTNFTDGEIAFRVRTAAESNPPGYNGAFFVGLDVTSDGGVDIFLGVINQGSSLQVGIFNPGTGLNNSPSTTTILSTPLKTYAQTASNYSWMAVTTGISGNDPAATSNDIDGGARQDFFLSFSMPFNDVVLALNGLNKPGVDDRTAMSFVAATSQQGNSLNQDLNGTSGNTSSTSTFSQLGTLTDVYSASGAAPVPEPTAIGLLGIGLAVLGGARRKAGANR